MPEPEAVLTVSEPMGRLMDWENRVVIKIGIGDFGDLKPLPIGPAVVMAPVPLKDSKPAVETVAPLIMAMPWLGCQKPGKHPDPHCRDHPCLLMRMLPVVDWITEDPWPSPPG